MQEIKLHSAEETRLREWEEVQEKIFQIRAKGLLLDQYQNQGGALINQVKNVLISFLAASQVMHGDMTLGMMMAITLVIGQLEVPISLLMNFVRLFQDAKLSLMRMNEVLQASKEDQMVPEEGYFDFNQSLEVRNLSFSYDNDPNECVLHGINFTMPYGSTTAIVGASGSGKTTLLKLLLKFYKPLEGNIFLGEEEISNISSREWRRVCGTVMQEGFIFTDSIKRNIIINEQEFDEKIFNRAIKLANVDEFVKNLPLKFDTVIGSGGTSLSKGQQQRIMIARAVYRDSSFLFFDEATSALDTQNERLVVENLKQKKKISMLVIAHRLSTVKDADQILVLDKGKIVERGQHQELVKKRGYYYKLIEDQLELNK